MRKFRNCGNKAGAVRGFEELQESGLGKIHCVKPQRGASMVSTIVYKECMYQRWAKNYKSPFEFS